VCYCLTVFTVLETYQPTSSPAFSGMSTSLSVRHAPRRDPMRHRRFQRASAPLLSARLRAVQYIVRAGGGANRVYRLRSYLVSNRNLGPTGKKKVNPRASSSMRVSNTSGGQVLLRIPRSTARTTAMLPGEVDPGEKAMTPLMSGMPTCGLDVGAFVEKSWF
jgi:hypothetical protein